ncbi:MAG: amino acid adenylation domain-containing protein [Synechococcales bacterium]|nr:amino acid adenylation domain-containing protein [Synechococcales bacterium]
MQGPVGCIHQCFEAQVRQHPNAAALLFEDQVITYETLNRRANQLAWYLKEQGIGPGSLVGICVERSPSMIVGLLGILKAGGGYVPLDPETPPERLNFVLDETEVAVVLTQFSLQKRFTSRVKHIVCLDQNWANTQTYSTENLDLLINPESVMYVIYTSGSTGKPKGVMIPHRGIHNQLQWRQVTFPLASSDRVLQNISFTFDPSVWQIFWPLTCGAQLVLPKPGGQKDVAYLMDLIAAFQVSVIALVPSFLDVLLRQPGLDRLSAIKHIFCGGEALPGELQTFFFQQWSQLPSPPPQLHNVYGPTEASIDASFWTCQRDRIEPIAPIGKPILNASLHVLDEMLQPVPEGTVGELYIGGAGLALGYLNRPELTAERFIPHSIAGAPSQRLYRTGDLARWLPDGLLAFVGRVDHQVKIRGFRIELGDIEAALRQHPWVTNVAVIARDSGSDKQLVACLTVGGAADGTVLSPASLSSKMRTFLQDKLPEYMVPAAYVLLDQLPLNANGKIDRRALQDLDLSLANPSAKTLPRNLIEACLTEIWSSVLGVEVGVDDHFFDLGGHSLLAIEICRLMEAALNKPIKPALLFTAPTIASLSERLQRGDTAVVPSLTISRPAGDKVPFFFVNSQGLLRKLLPHIEANQPVYGLNILGLIERYQDNLSEVTLGAIAADMMQDILAIQPDGPYQLIAYCGDSRLTLEIAQQMKRQGHDINLLFIDAIWDEQKPDLKSYWQNMRRLGLSYLWTKLARLIKGQHRKALKYYANVQRRYQAYETAHPTRRDRNVAFLKKFAQLSWTYQGEPYPDKIVLLLSSEWLALNTPALAQLACGGLEIHEVKGYHHTLFEDGYVQELAQKITNYLQS